MVSTPYGRVVALDPTSGKENWVFPLPTGNPSTRGVEHFVGDATTPPQIVEEGVRSLRSGRTHYTSNYGTLELRRALAAHLEQRYGLVYDPEGEIIIAKVVVVLANLNSFNPSLPRPWPESLHPQPDCRRRAAG